MMTDIATSGLSTKSGIVKSFNDMEKFNGIYKKHFKQRQNASNKLIKVLIHHERIVFPANHLANVLTNKTKLHRKIYNSIDLNN